jgi:hypothetical protein
VGGHRSHFLVGVSGTGKPYDGLPIGLIGSPRSVS